MTVKVINPEPDSSVVKKKVCNNCGATLEYVPADVQHRDTTDYTGGSGFIEWIVCPNCKVEVTVKAR